MTRRCILSPRKMMKGSISVARSVATLTPAAATEKTSILKHEPYVFLDFISQYVLMGTHCRREAMKRPAPAKMLMTVRAQQAYRTAFLVPPSRSMNKRTEALTADRVG